MYVSQTVLTLWQTAFILYIFDFQHLKFNDWYVYLDWAYTLGWIMMFSTVLMVPIWAAGQCVGQKEPSKRSVSHWLGHNKIHKMIFDFSIFVWLIIKEDCYPVCFSVWQSCAVLPGLAKEDNRRGQNKCWTNNICSDNSANIELIKQGFFFFCYFS